MTSIPNDGEKNNEALPPDSLDSNPTGERRLKNWIQSFGEWALPRCDAPKEFVFWSGVYTIAAALRRQVVIPKRHLGSWECFPHLYVMFVGPPGMRKTTSMMEFANPLLSQVGSLRSGPTYFTKEILTDQMIQSPDTSVYLMVGEFADLMQKNKAGEMYDFLTSMYDNKPNLEVGTMMRGIQVGKKPSLNMFAATTPAWISENMTAGVIGGGFASRVLFVYADKLRDPQLIYTSKMKELNTDELEKDLLNDLIEISNLSGEFEIEEGLEDKLNRWNSKHAASAPIDPRFAGYHSRKPMMVLKLAMIHSVATKSDLVVTEEDFIWGLGALESTEPQLSKIFAGIGKNEYVFDMDAITGFVITRGEVTEEDIYDQFRAAASPDKLSELIRGCVQCGDLLYKRVEGKIVYYPND